MGNSVDQMVEDRKGEILEARASLSSAARRRENSRGPRPTPPAQQPGTGDLRTWWYVINSYSHHGSDTATRDLPAGPVVNTVPSTARGKVGSLVRELSW